MMEKKIKRFLKGKEKFTDDDVCAEFSKETDVNSDSWEEFWDKFFEIIDDRGFGYKFIWHSGGIQYLYSKGLTAEEIKKAEELETERMRVWRMKRVHCPKCGNVAYHRTRTDDYRCTQCKNVSKYSAEESEIISKLKV